MPKFQKKPVVIEARRWSGANAVPLLDWINAHEDDRTAFQDGSSLIIPTLEGNHEASLGDWIIQGVAGEFYPCKPDIFEATYEPA